MGRESAPLNVGTAPKGGLVSLERTLKILAEHPDRESTVAVFGQALREERARSFAISWLLAASETRASRELIRAWDVLTPGDRRRVLETAQHRLFTAALQLVGADRATTRRNVAEVLAGGAAQLQPELETILPSLAQLVDDPDRRTREFARGAFLEAIIRTPEAIAQRPPQDPRLVTLSLLLRNWAQHRDTRVIDALLVNPTAGDEWLQRAVDEQWPVGEVISRHLGQPHDSGGARRHLELLLRWNRSPLPSVRQKGRELLRNSKNRELLRAAAWWIDRRDDRPDLATWKRTPWWQLSDDDLRALRPSTLLWIAELIADVRGDPQERAERLARLVPLTDGAPQREILERLRGLPVETVLPQLLAVLDQGEEDAKAIVIELLPLSAEGALPALIPLLASPQEMIRESAAQRLYGQGLRLWRRANAEIPSSTRSATLTVLRKVDPTFDVQLKESLASSEESDVLLGLDDVAELDDLSGFEELLVDLVVSRSERVRAGVARALPSTGETTAWKYLEILLEDRDPRVVANAVEELGHLQLESSTPRSREATGHPHPRVRANAWVALGLRGDDEALPAVTSWSERASEPDRRSALWAIEQLKGLHTV